MFWYSFYERGAVMADFCRRALAYMTGRPLEDFAKKKQLELSELLLRQLQARPWLLVLDGLERVLVAYHRIDAAQLADEQAGSTDEIADRDPCAAIRPDDDDLLRALTAAAPSKILVTSRLLPQVLLNRSGQPMPGVLHERLPGLRPADAEALLRSCGVDGDAHAIRDYLQRHCDCHPLVTGIVAGSGRELPARPRQLRRLGRRPGARRPARRGRAGPRAEAQPHPAQRARRAATSRAGSCCRPWRCCRRPSTTTRSPRSTRTCRRSRSRSPSRTIPPTIPGGRTWPRTSNGTQRQEYEAELARHGEYQQALTAWRSSPAVAAAPRRLAATVADLERRGLLQYDPQARRYDLHPVVRAVAAGGLRGAELDRLGQPRRRPLLRPDRTLPTRTPRPSTTSATA